ncbi:MAG: Arc family DNA binding domain-containing protein [Planctomycetota bacterium]
MDAKKSFLLRIPPDLWKEIESWAAGELRSVNGQIEYLLREAAARRKKPTPPPEGKPEA